MFKPGNRSSKFQKEKWRNIFYKTFYLNKSAKVKPTAHMVTNLASATFLLAKSLLQKELWLPRGITPMGIFEISSY